MARVFIPSQLRDVTGGVDEVDAVGGTLRQVVAALEVRFPGVAARLTEGDQLAPGIAASIDGVVTSRGLFAKVGPESEVHFIPAIGGG